ncbi:Uncharacterized conserved protein, Ntn-hydrolase superfamily [Albimonas donghaensis]|uniref:Uncharacterized conserved protein, Ntn-hydrolase superfamily n=1 Tax=Albimonas donghaensis TaxID=356660 RepID=A0A1H3ELP2_9RHOB|nr:DUF1028 domain-containing protein [Albimonas donghaensis]SDX79611.1 Uncharacterized conserved protein, Ntn-hydrolase superfamily [Albimonas donghaensis]
MTFSIVGRCARTGAFGAAITTSDLAVGSRCVGLVHGKGGVLSQHRTDSRLRDLGARRLAEGDDAETTLGVICDSTPDIEWRQVGVIDAQGRVAVHHGRAMYSIFAHSAGPDCLALGNILDNPDVPAAMAAAFGADPAAALADRLMAALVAGRDAGGEVGDRLVSAALRVTGPHEIDTCDLRVDLADGDAVGDLAKLHAAWGARGETLRKVMLAPDTVPVSRQIFEASVARIKELGLEDRFPAERRRNAWTLTA